MDKIYSRTKIKLPNLIKDSKKWKKILIIIILIIMIFFSIDMTLSAVNPIFETLCEDKAKSIATIVSNEQATKVINEYKYEDLFSIEKDVNGNIIMIKSNINPINGIISDVGQKIQEELNKQGRNNIQIALGSFTGIKLLSGRGPGINIQISSIGNVETDLRSEFTAQGINQTLHRVYLQVDCEVSILTPFKDIDKKISNQVLLLENVIIGTVPNTYYNIEGIDKSQAVDIIE